MTDTQTQPSSQALPPSTDAKKPGVPKSAKTKRPKPLNIWPFVVLVLLIFSLAAVASVYFWQQLEQQTIQIQMLSKTSETTQSQLSQRNRSIQTRFKEINSLLDTQAKHAKELKQQSHFNTQQLHDLGARNRADWLMAEAEYLMHLANQRLSLEQDVRSAEAILVSADQVLAENDDPGLLLVRKALAADIFALQQTKTADVEGLYLRLSAMIKSLNHLGAQAFLNQKVDTVPTNEISPSVIIIDDAASSWRSFLNDMWRDLQKVFVIRRLDHMVEPLLAPEQSYYLKQNLRLMLEQASLSIMERNQVIYSDSLEKASFWLHSYFDVKNVSSSALLQHIDEMKLIQINPAIPDISGSLRLLKSKIESMYLNHSLGKLSQTSQSHERNINEPNMSAAKHQQTLQNLASESKVEGGEGVAK